MKDQCGNSNGIFLKGGSRLLQDVCLVYSSTNNQERRVDEADILKTDGQFIYTVTNKVLSILKSHPAI